MAGHNRSSRPRPNQRTTTKRLARTEAFSELLATAAGQDLFHQIRTGVSTADALQMCLDRAVAIWQFCADQSNKQALSVTDDGEVVGFFEIQIGPGGALTTIPNRWVGYEREARQDIERLASTMTSLGIAERTVRVAEAQATLLAASVREAAIDAGIPPEQVRLLGEALRTRLETATADVSPSPPRPRHETAQSPATLLSASASQDPTTSRAVASEGPGHHRGDNVGGP